MAIRAKLFPKLVSGNGPIKSIQIVSMGILEMGMERLNVWQALHDHTCLLQSHLILGQ